MVIYISILHYQLVHSMPIGILHLHAQLDKSAGFFHVGQLVTCTTGTTVCVIEGRNTENHDGIIADWLRIVESFDNMQLCHNTYLKESIGIDKYNCNSKVF